MPTHPDTFHAARRRARAPALPPRAMALVLVLFMVSLLSVALVALLSSVRFNDSSSFRSTQAQAASSVARSALDVIAHDLAAEMRAASLPPAPDSHAHPLLIPVATPPGAMRPAPVVDPDLAADPSSFPTLVKQSGLDRFFPDLPPYTSTSASPLQDAASDPQLLTSLPALGGRSFSPLRWASPRLSTAPTPTQAAPRWVLLTRQGIATSGLLGTGQGSVADASPDNPSFVTGRFAFQIYDISGLLDANAAGYSDAEPGYAARQPGKGDLAFAKLSRLSPAFDDGLFFSWRNAATQGAFLQALDNAIQPAGWHPGALAGASGDARFLSRGELVRFALTRPGLDPAALPSLTHFSRAVDAPSLLPANPPGTTIDYQALALDQDAVNPHFAAVPVTTAFTRRDGSPAQPGEALLTSRFPLSSIDLLAADPQDPALIRSYFGLSRDSSSPRWIYADLSPSNTIKTLHQVAEDGREPNFFELLQAGILHGSLASSTAVNGIYDNRTLDLNATRQILTVGLSIIDQWDADPIPTVIRWGGDANTLADVDLAGIENLPYLELIGQAHVTRREPESADPLWPTISAYYQPRLWNPHRNAPSAPAARLRITLTGAPYVRCNWWPNRYANPPAMTETGQPRYSSPENNHITFSYPIPQADHPQADHPVQLLGKMVDPSATSPDNLLPTGDPNPAFVGLHLGDVTMGTANPSIRNSYPGGYVEATGHIYFDQPATIHLQVETPGGWLTYQTIPRIERHHGNVPWRYGPYDSRVYQGIPTLRITYAHSDPRTSRFGWTTVGEGISSQTVGRLIWDAAESRRWLNNWGGGGNITGTPGAVYSLAANHPSSSLRATDNDGLLRPAEGRPDQHAFSDPAARPVILDRAFHNVGELAYAFRDEPWKSLDLSSATSADAALLDLFTIHPRPRVVAGSICPARAPLPVLESLLEGAQIDPITASQLTPDQASSLAAAIATAIAAAPDLRSPGDLVQALHPVQSALPGPHPNREAAARALSGIVDTRTWNLFVDLVAQAGRYPASASSLQDFRVEAESRYWIHLAIDRLTGQLIESQWEIATE